MFVKKRLTRKQIYNNLIIHCVILHILKTDKLSSCSALLSPCDHMATHSPVLLDHENVISSIIELRHLAVLMVQYAPCYSRIIDAKALAIKTVLLKLIGSVGSHLICELGMRRGVFGLVGSLGRNSLIMVHVILEPYKPRISVSESV